MKFSISNFKHVALLTRHLSNPSRPGNAMNVSDSPNLSRDEVYNNEKYPSPSHTENTAGIDNNASSGVTSIDGIDTAKIVLPSGTWGQHGIGRSRRLYLSRLVLLPFMGEQARAPARETIAWRASPGGNRNHGRRESAIYVLQTTKGWVTGWSSQTTSVKVTLHAICAVDNLALQRLL